MRATSKTRRPGRRGFSLLELLAVITIIVILLVLVAPSFLRPLKGNRLTVAGDALVAALDSARLVANLQNVPVVFEFVRTTPPVTSASSDPRLIGYRVREQRADGSFETGALVRLPETVTALEDTGYDTLLTDGSLSQQSVTDETIGPDPATLISFRFFPDGATDLPSNPTGSGEKWFLTLVQTEEPDLPPPNFTAIAIEPATGRVFQFRP